ncbi:ParB N-terminal domain-containing protein [Vibrio vulnificus]|nr:ParB N-terminal domain-containing protein [Vibrio vulnificus]ELV8614182.1 ParB N-terminal domain-containing protein [Vibrio vulnificus]MCU8137713.1 hypothetical protein [Vibrio vulnificus]
MSKITQEQVDEFNRKRREEQQRRAEERDFCNKIMELYAKGSLDPVKPCWHLDKKYIDFDNQDFHLSDELCEQGYRLIPSVDVETLLDAMQSGNPELYRSKSLFHKHWSDEKICNVVKHWQNNEKLIPPTIVYNHLLHRLYVADGKHRFNVAYYFGTECMPIIVPNVQLEKIKPMLGCTET